MKLQGNNLINQRLEEFKALGAQNNDQWFSELCFCILTANSQAKKAISIQENLGPEGFLTKTQQQLAEVIKSFGHRFHNNKAKYIVEARKFLVKNIKGLGFKEASHFLRNVGYNNVAIIDRHVLRYLHRENLIDQIPKTMTPKKYLEFEQILSSFNIPQSKLDLIIWQQMTGGVLK